MNFTEFRGGYVEDTKLTEAKKRASAALKGQSFHSRQALLDAQAKLIKEFIAEGS